MIRHVVISLAMLLAPTFAWSASSFEIESLREKHHVTADRTLYHSREKVYEAFGHVVVSSHGQRLSADYVWVDENTKEMKARGNVIFVNQKMTVQAAEITYNLDTSIGSIFYGKVFNDFYTLKGQLIRRISEERFLTTEGEYTTCKDCAESWKLSAKYVDMTMEGYAFLDSVYVKLKDVPTLYLPYAILPVKTKRQTGLLFPRMGASTNNGFIFMQPLFIAIDSHQDMTIAAGKYSRRGLRYEGEYRYKSFNGIGGQFNYYQTNDRTDNAPSRKRTAIKADNELPISDHLGMRWRVREVLDRDYLEDFSDDMEGLHLSALESNALATAWYNDFFLSAEVRRYRNMLYDRRTTFDTGMVQATPTIHGGLKERTLLGPLMGSFYGRFDNFTRGNGSFQDQNNNRLFDENFASSVENPELVRAGQRFIFSPELSMPFRIGRYLSIGPSVQYNEIRYNFNVPLVNGTNLGPTSRRYLQSKVEASAVLEKVYDYNGQKVSRLKHQLVPFMTFSYIPWIRQNEDNIFQKQLSQRSEGLFDQYDIVPVTNSTSFLRFPQGKSIYYGVTSRLIRKLKRQEEMPRAYPYDLLPPSAPKKYLTPQNRRQELMVERDKLWDANNPRYEDYQEIWNVNISQAFDFIEARNQQAIIDQQERTNQIVTGDRKRAFSYLQANSTFSIDQFSHRVEYRYYPRIVTLPDLTHPTESVLRNKHKVFTALDWNWVSMTNLRKTRSFERGVSLSYTNNSLPDASRNIGSDLRWSVNDFINMKLKYNFDLLSHNQLQWTAMTQLVHPSECWGVALHYDWLRTRTPVNHELGFELLLNITGAGFMGTAPGASGGSGHSTVFGGI